MPNTSNAKKIKLKNLHKYKSLEINLNKKILGDFIGVFNNSVKGIGSEFESLKQYEVGDNIKSIDWKKSAKNGTIFTRNYENKNNLNITFVININSSVNFGSREKTKLETLLETYYILAKTSIESGYNIGAFINNNFINLNNSNSSVIKIFNEIIKTSNFLKSKNKIKNKSKSKSLNNLNIKNNLIFYIDLEYLNINNKDNINTLKYLSIKNNIIYINIFDSFENTLSEDKFTFSSGFLDIFTGDKKRLDYIELRKNKALALRRILLKYKIKYLSLDDETNVYLKLFKMLKKGI